MKTKLSISQRIKRAIEIAGRHRVRNQLLAMSDRSLEDIGFSRALLEKGVDAWPWRVEEVEAEVIRAKFTQRAQSTHVLQDLPNVA